MISSLLQLNSSHHCDGRALFKFNTFIIAVVFVLIYSFET